jgi:hexosaminidase
MPVELCGLRLPQAFRHGILAVLLLVFLRTNAQHGEVFPQPDAIVRSGGQVALHDSISYCIPHESWLTDAISTQFLALHGLKLGKSDSRCMLRVREDLQMPDESYRLKIGGSSEIEITASGPKGFFYAMQTLDQLMGLQRGEVLLPSVDISDGPAFAYRGVHLDGARHFFTVDELKGFIDQCARLKFNRFHWHLTDDQGWRLEIKRYPELTAVGAWRDSTLIGHYSSVPQRYEKARYGGSYTQEEAREIVRYAAERGMTVIPEIEMPGHARAALAAYPDLGCTGDMLPVAGTWGVFDDIFCSKESTRIFLKNVLDEVMEVFPSEVIHIGGDEAPKIRWEKCPHCAEVMKSHGLHDAHELQSFFIQDIEDHVRSKGRTIIGWDEILEGGLAENAQVMSWRGTEGGIAAANLGHKVVMTPTAYCYLDYYQSGNPDEPLAIGGFLPLEKVYSFDPVPGELGADRKHFITGGQANLWTEYLRTMRDVQYSLFPRLIAMSEVLWTGRKTTYGDFATALTESYLPRLKAQNVNYSLSFLDPTLVPESVENGIRYNVIYPVAPPRGMSQTNGFTFFREMKEPKARSIQVYLPAKGTTGKEVARTYTFVSHSVVGIPVEFGTPPDPKFDNHGELGLTDGVVGARPWKGDQWLGFSTDTIVFSIDLGKARKVKGLQLGTLDDPGSWIYAPEKIIVEGGKSCQYRKIASAGVSGERIDIALSGRYRRIRVTVINKAAIPEGLPGAGTIPWTFLDELMIR